MNVTPLGLREAGTSLEAQPRTVRRPSLSHILIALAAILAFVFNFLALQDRSDTTLVAVASSDLSAGDRITSSDITFVPVAAGFAGVDSLLGEPQWDQREGWVLNRAIASGSVIDVASLSAPGNEGNLRSMSIPVAIEHAAGGLLEEGDIVDVVTVSDGIPKWVATGMPVVGIASADSGSIGGFGPFHVVVSVTAEQALNLASAIDSGSIEIVRATGAEETGG